MLRIAIDCRMIGSGGIGTFISELIPYFLEHNECLLIGTHEQCMDFLRLQNVEFCYCDVKPFSMQEMFSFPQDVLNAIHKYDCYFTPYCNIPGGIQIPVFSTIHDIVFLDVKGLTGFLGRIGRKYFYQRAINMSKMIFTVSEFSKSRILAKLHCKKAIKVVYNSFPSYLIQKSEEFVSPQKTNSILFVGNIKKHKGLKILLDAFEKAKKQGLKSRLVIVGNKDNFRTGDEETVERLNNFSNDQIEFTGKITNEKLRELYASALVLVQPSLYEGFGIPPLEAMVMGTPAIISDIPVFKEIYKDFPVEYYNAQNSDELCKKLLEAESSPKKIELGSLKEKYSYKKSAILIEDSLSDFLKQQRT